MTGTLHEDQYTFMIISPSILLIMRKFSGKSCRGNQNTFYVQYLKKWCCLRDNVERYGRGRQAVADNMIQDMPFACWITESTDAHSEYVILTAFQRQQLLRENASMLRLFVYCLFW